MFSSERNLKVFEFSSKVGVSPQTIRRWCSQGKIGYHRASNGYRMIPESELPKAKKLRRKRHYER